jgi:hypothetical protein
VSHWFTYLQLSGFKYPGYIVQIVAFTFRTPCMSVKDNMGMGKFALHDSRKLTNSVSVVPTLTCILLRFFATRWFPKHIGLEARFCNRVQQKF